MRISKTPNERKQEILDTAINVFLTKGYEQTSISDIAKAMNISQGLCYRYFKSKEEIYNCALDEYVNEGLTSFGNILLDSNLSIIEKLKRLPDVAKDTNQNTSKHNYYNQNINIQEQVLFKLNRKLLPIVIQALDIAVKKNEISCDNVTSIAYFILYGQLGVFLCPDLSQEEKDMYNFKIISKILGIDFENE